MKDLNEAIQEMSSEAYIKMFDFATDSEFKPTESMENVSNEDLLKELGV